MATEVTLPEMGEGVEDVTISRWLVREGDVVKAGDPLLAVATDKVDTEIPTPVAGTVLTVNFSEGEIIDLNTVIVVIGDQEEAGHSDSTTAVPNEIPVPSEPQTPGPFPAPDRPTAIAVKATPVARRMAAQEGIPLAAIANRSTGQITKSDVEAFLQDKADVGTAPPFEDVVPLEVRRLAAAYDIDLRAVAGDAPLSTLTRHDLRKYAAEQKGLAHLAPGPQYPLASTVTHETQVQATEHRSAAPAVSPQADELIPHSRMRQIIARNMVQSAFTAPHVTTVHGVDMTAVTSHYQAHKGAFAKEGVRLTLTAYIVVAVVAGLKAVPAANAEWREEGLLLTHAYHIGMAVALPADATGVGGLIVPVIRNAGDLNLMGIARQVAGLSRRARENALTPADMQGGTFTLTNYGTSGSLFQTPVIVQPQVAILGTGAIEKRPVVVSHGKPYEARVDDYLAFHPMMDLALSYDHRVLDGASADAFCVAVKQTLEQWTESTSA